MLLSPEPFPGSPTEKATTIATTSPKSPLSPIPDAHDYHEHVRNALQTLLPETLREVLPGVLCHLLVPQPSPSLQSGSTPIPPLYNLVSPDMVARANEQLQAAHDETVEHIAQLRDTAETEFCNDLENFKWDISVARDDGVTELKRIMDHRLDEFTDSTAGIVCDVEERAERVYNETCDRLDRLQRFNRSIERDRVCIMCKKDIEANKRRDLGSSCQGLNRSSRAVSLPL